MSGQVLLWGGFAALVVGFLVLDLTVFHRKAHVVTFKEAVLWSLFWISLALLFNVGVYIWLGSEKALEFLTGYLVEESLSIDNLFVFLLLFTYFRVPAQYQHRVLFWGIIGAFVMRLTLIVVGVALIERFHWIIFIFGAFLVFTGVRMAFKVETDVEPGRNPVVRLFQRLVPVTSDYHGSNFWVRTGGKLFATPLMIVLVIVETTDLVFALDSIPAIFALTTDPFIVYTSNVFAILGLRSIYFALAGFLALFYYLKYALAAVLTFVGVKMLLLDIVHVPIVISLGVIATFISIATVASIIRAKRLQAAYRAGTAGGDH